MVLRLTTLPGLEGFAAEEAEAALGTRVSPRSTAPGCVDLDVDEAACSRLLVLRTVTDLLVPFAELRVGPAPTLDGIAREVEALELPPPRGATFRVRTERRGDHPFTRVDVERVVGGVLHRRLGLGVDLERPAWIVRADLDGDHLRLAHLLTPRPLGRRPGPFTQRVGLAAPLAAAAVRLAGAPPPRAVLDPFCGSGTLLLEAGWAFPEARLLGGDWTRRAARGAAENLRAAGLAERSEVAHRDARRLDADYAPGSIDLLLTNPPFGLRIGQKIRFFGFYRRLLAAARRLLAPSRGRVVVLAHKRGQLFHAARREGFEVRHSIPVTTGDARPTLVRLDPTA